MDFGDSMLRMIAALAVVLALMMVIVAVARRLLAGRQFGRTGAPPLVQVLGTGYLGPRKNISLVSVAGELLIIGTTANDLVPLGRLSDPERVLHSLQAGEMDVKADVTMHGSSTR
jgi:flagellar protein FliO/FliZ